MLKKFNCKLRQSIICNYPAMRPFSGSYCCLLFTILTIASGPGNTKNRLFYEHSGLKSSAPARFYKAAAPKYPVFGIDFHLLLLYLASISHH
jgi:hypothetical protein